MNRLENPSGCQDVGGSYRRKQKMKRRAKIVFAVVYAAAVVSLIYLVAAGVK